MPIGALIPAIISGVATIGSGLIASNAADKAADAQGDAADKAAGIQWKMYKTTRRDLAPYAGYGVPAMKSLAGMYGLTPDKKAFNASSLMAFRNSPDYQVAMREGIDNIDSSAAARGMLKSGATLKGVADYASDLGSRKFEDYMSSLFKMAGMGQSAAAGQGAAAMATGSNLAQTYGEAGDAAAAGIVGSGNAWSGALSNMGSNLAYFAERNPSAFSRQPSPA